MKAGLLRAPNTLELTEVPDPRAEPGDLILKVRAATVCGTDIRIFRGRKTAGIRYPSVIGHEFAGEVAEAPAGSGFSSGDRVCVDPAIPCGHCAYCKTGAENICDNLTAIGYEVDGAFAEYVRIPARALATGNVHHIPGHLSFEEAALAEPFACVVNGQQQVSVGVGDAVVILGAGPIGLLHVKLARLSGARRVMVSEPSAGRRAAATAAGADIVIDPTTEDLRQVVRDATRGLGADVAIVAIGVPALANQALGLVRKRGRVSLFAGFSVGDSAPLDINLIHYSELVLTGSFGLARSHFERALDLIGTGRIDVKPFVTHRFGLPAIAEALAMAEQGAAIKVAILNP
ncbi:zinc-dependent dehydrogenase [Lichenihabitans sp. Uapishka_5]|uniref:zinc-dependent dehydrogenase n=1 Tax=Lichenihabitans sp. Uapishka_5 TaxID=3037302 RepID=UPI0029E7FD47|nr:zinc-dependent dehydrogenase [Lichenihabitans sp. Uapishka_5]MDX7952105.1 zinc-dependent dehydrogenase [Lichenihabitans sp. Uapishka_5]